MDWIDGKPHNFTQLPVKLVFFVKDPATLIANVGKKGGSIVLNATYNAALGATVGFARDPDGYLLEINGR
jgi:lactoylglutathione lyase